MARIKRWIPLAVATVLVIALAVGLLVQTSQTQQLRSQLSGGSAAASTQSSELANAQQEIQTLQAKNSSLSGQVTSLTGQVASLSGQVASLTNQNSTLSNEIATLNAQFPPPTSCTADPGVRANVNQISLQVVGESTTQALVNYLCQNGLTAPSSVRSFLGSESLNDLRQRFGYG